MWKPILGSGSPGTEKREGVKTLKKTQTFRLSQEHIELMK